MKFRLASLKNEHNNGDIGTFRRILPQIIASTVKNFLLWDFGLTIAFPTILIPALTGLSTALNPDETLKLSPVETTWLASITYICQPVGSICSGFITESFGRRRAMMIVSIPHVIGWITLFYANSLTTILIPFALHGIGIGLMEAPIFTYIGEICEPSIRGILTATAGIAGTAGMFTVYILGIMLSWRQAALACATIPALSIILLCFVPETPIWLLSKNREDEALRSLQWLRGWVSKEVVKVEFEALKQYRKVAQSCYECEKENNICTHEAPTLKAKLKDALRSRTARPFVLLIFLFFLLQFCGFVPIRPYIVQILKSYQSPIDASMITVWLGAIGIAGNVFLLFLLKLLGKRKIFLLSIATVFISCCILALYGFFQLPSGISSFDPNVNTQAKDTSVTSYLILFCFFLLQFAGSCGVTTIPNMLLSEILPFNTRAVVTGVAASLAHVFGFCSAKSFFGLESAFTLPGMFIFNGSIALLGFLVTFFVLPETEGRTLAEIEAYYSNKNRKITDIHIPTSSLAVNSSNDAKYRNSSEENI